jgi:Protein of unknown function (DUF3309)
VTRRLDTRRVARRRLDECACQPNPAIFEQGEVDMTIGTILLIILILLLIGAIPSWPHSRAWGYGPSGILGVVLVVVIVLLLMGRL